MMTKTKPAESVAVRCTDLERQIAEAAVAIADAMAVAKTAATPATLQEAQSKIEFMQLQRRRFVEERVALEVARLEEAVAIATKAHERQIALPALVARRRELRTELDKLDHDIVVAEFDDTRLSNAISAAQRPLTLLQSQRPIDVGPKQQLALALRERLEALA